MKKNVGGLIALLFLMADIYGMTAREIVKKVEDSMRGRSSVGEMEMRVVKKEWSRTLKMKFWEKGKEKALVVITSPAKERGVATLKIGKNVWNYIPSIERVIKIPSSMMGASWMGSHFTNDDLVKEYSIVDDYNPELKSQDREFYYLVLYPKPQAAVVWGRVEIKVSKKTFIPEVSSYFDEKGNRIRRIEYMDVRRVGKRYFPFHWVLYPEKKPGEKTEIIVHKIKFDVSIPDRIFTLKCLKEMKR
ncbi:MAG: outer membrane lipoprotein-sorting protein [Candidatus Aminicenantes bacterium]|nr:outer membrane lipoprotein-sorting protein [Candidatus Aminicenantes bacterium]